MDLDLHGQPLPGLPRTRGGRVGVPAAVHREEQEGLLNGQTCARRARCEELERWRRVAAGAAARRRLRVHARAGGARQILLAPLGLPRACLMRPARREKN